MVGVDVVDFFVLVIFGWVGYGMVVIVIGFYFENVGALVGVGIFDCFFAGFFYREYVYVVNGFVFDLETDVVLEEFDFGRGVRDAGAYCILVVFDDIDDW